MDVATLAGGLEFIRAKAFRLELETSIEGKCAQHLGVSRRFLKSFGPGFRGTL